MTASAVLLKARRLAGLSQSALARRAGTSQSAISRREHGLEQPTLEALERLLYACGMRLDLNVKPLPLSPRREALLEKRQEIAQLLARYGASNPRVFGSVARGDDKDGSDVDLIVDLPPSVGQSRLLGILSLSSELSAITGLDVDVSTEDLLAPEIRENALRDAVAF